MNYVPSDLKVVGTRPVRPDGVDKVTGRAQFGADMVMPGMLWGKVKRSPHAHARIVSIDASKALKPAGREGRRHRRRFPRHPVGGSVRRRRSDEFPRPVAQLHGARQGAVRRPRGGRGGRHHRRRSPTRRSTLIDVKYEVLPHVIDVEAAMAPDAPVLHDDLFTADVEPKPTKPSNVAKRVYFNKGDVEAGFKQAEVIVEGRYTTEPVHQAYIEPHACLARMAPDGQSTIFSSSPGPFHGARLRGQAARHGYRQHPRAPRPRSAAASAARRWSISSRWRSRCRRSAAVR